MKGKLEDQGQSYKNFLSNLQFWTGKLEHWPLEIDLQARRTKLYPTPVPLFCSCSCFSIPNPYSSHDVQEQQFLHLANTLAYPQKVSLSWSICHLILFASKVNQTVPF